MTSIIGPMDPSYHYSQLVDIEVDQVGHNRQEIEYIIVMDIDFVYIYSPILNYLWDLLYYA